MQTEIKKQYDNLKAEFEAKKKELSVIAKDAFSASSKELFEQHPIIDSFGWTQYTPYFNDGDTCYFSVNSDSESVFVNGEREYDIDWEDVIDDLPKGGKWGSKEYEQRHSVIEAHPLYKAYDAVSELLQQFDDDLLEQMFEDHAHITVSRDGTVDVDEYSHD